MAEAVSTSSHEENFQFKTSQTRYHGLIDVPFTTTLKENLTSLFNFLDIYGPKISEVHQIVAIFRMFQLIGCSFMYSNVNIIERKTVTFSILNYIAMLFHILPINSREGNEYIVLYILNALLFFGVYYLIFIAFRYKKTAIVSKFSINTLTIFTSFFPFLIIPISIQFAGQIISGLISKKFQVEVNTIVLNFSYNIVFNCTSSKSC